MLATLPLLIGLPMVMIWPVWYLRNRKRPSSPLIVLLPLPGLVLWFLLFFLGVGGTSRQLLYEPLGVGMIAVMIAYWKLFKLDVTHPGRAGQTALLLLLLATLAVRLTAPG